jgi:hypothetical protein
MKSVTLEWLETKVIFISHVARIMDSFSHSVEAIKKECGQKAGNLSIETDNCFIKIYGKMNGKRGLNVFIKNTSNGYTNAENLAIGDHWAETLEDTKLLCSFLSSVSDLQLRHALEKTL